VFHSEGTVNPLSAVFKPSLSVGAEMGLATFLQLSNQVSF